MEVKQQIRILISLQDVDARMIELQKKQKGLPEQITEMAKDVAVLEEVVGRERAELEQEDKWRAEKEEEHEFLEAQISRLRKQIQDARAHKEALALQRQLDASRKQESDLADELLQTMSAIDQRRTAIEEHEGSLNALKEQLAAEEARIQKELGENQVALEAAEAERDEKASSLDSGIRKRYMGLATRRFPSVVEARDGGCTGCNMALLPQLYNTLYRANSIEVCPQCYRMLYLKAAVFPEDEVIEGEGGGDAADDETLNDVKADK